MKYCEAAGVYKSKHMRRGASKQVESMKQGSCGEAGMDRTAWDCGGGLRLGAEFLESEWVLCLVWVFYK